MGRTYGDEGQAGRHAFAATRKLVFAMQKEEPITGIKQYSQKMPSMTAFIMQRVPNNVDSGKHLLLPCHFIHRQHRCSASSADKHRESLN